MRTLLLLSILLCSTAFAQLEVSTIPASMLIDVDRITQIDDIVLVPNGTALATRPVVVLTVKTEASNVEVQASDLQRLPVESRQLSEGRWLFETPGKFWVEVVAIDFEKNIYGRKTVVVEVGQGPNPPPTPPGPTPRPTPGPSPTPAPPSPNGPPIAGEGLRVLFVHESAEALSPALREVFYGPTVREYLLANAIKVDNTPDWRIVDQDTKFTDPNHRFAKALARPRTALPWLIISNGVNGYEGPFPGGVAETLELIKSFSTVQVLTKPTLYMYVPPSSSGESCLWCDKFKAMELGSLLDNPSIDYREVEDKTRSVAKYPTFVLRKGDRTTTLVGYQTAAKLIEEASKL